MNERILKTFLTAFVHTKSKIIGEIPMVNELEKKRSCCYFILIMGKRK